MTKNTQKLMLSPCPTPENCTVWIQANQASDPGRYRYRLYRLDASHNDPDPPIIDDIPDEEEKTRQIEKYKNQLRLYFQENCSENNNLFRESLDQKHCCAIGNTNSNDFQEDAIDGNDDTLYEQYCRLTYQNIISVAKFIEQELESIADMESAIFDNYSATVLLNSRSETGLVCPFAYWHPKIKQAIFLQSKVSSFASVGRILDVVAHEFCHGIISQLSEGSFDNRGESGALEESLCDIFAILVSNSEQHNIRDWNWTIGQGLIPGGGALRDLSNPTTSKQPDHMEKYDESSGVHINNGIHNKAFYNIATSTSDGRYLFDRDFLIQLFLGSLLEIITEDIFTYSFLDSRVKMIEVANVLLENDSQRAMKIDMINTAFDNVGIVQWRHVLRLLKRRLGTLSVSEEQIRQLTDEQLKELGRVLLTFENETALLAWLQQVQ